RRCHPRGGVRAALAVRRAADLSLRSLDGKPAGDPPRGAVLGGQGAAGLFRDCAAGAGDRVRARDVAVRQRHRPPACAPRPVGKGRPRHPRSAGRSRESRRLVRRNPHALGGGAARAFAGGEAARFPCPRARAHPPGRPGPDPLSVGRAAPAGDALLAPGRAADAAAERARPAARRGVRRSLQQYRVVLSGSRLMARYVLAIDQGTTGSTALVLDQRLSVKAKANVEFRQIFPKPGWVEHDLDDIWTATLKAIATAMRQASIKPAELQAIGITNQRETTLLWTLTGGAVHATDVTNASRARFMDLGTRGWDNELLALFGVPRAVLPAIKPSAGVFGTTKGVKGLPDGVPIAGIAGDQQSAL